MSILIPSLRSTVAVPSWAKNELWRRARAVPSLDQRFAESKSLVDAVSGQQLITFTRASDGAVVNSAGQIEIVAANVPRFDHNPLTGECLGLLVEEQRQNLLLQSNQFDTTWTNTNSSETAASGIAPDGTNTAWELRDTVDVSAVSHAITQSSSITSGVTYTYSVWMKAGTLGFGAIAFPSAGFTTSVLVSFNLSTGSASVNTGTATAAVVSAGNGWYRCSVTATATASVSTGLGARTANNISAGTYQGDGTGTILIWGAQLEAGAFPTSYIPTTGTAVTRSADVASITGDNFSRWYRADEGTMVVDGATPAFVGTTGFVSINAASNNNRFEIRQNRNNPNLTGASVDVAWTNVVLAPTLAANTSYKQATAFSNASHGNSIAGSLDTSSTVIGTIAATQLAFGWRGTQTAPTGGSSSAIRRVTFWSQRLPNATLQNITL